MDHRPLTILIAEDEVLLRMDLSLGLETLGHTVLEAGDAASALNILDRHDIDVLVTDIDMPGERDGLALALDVRQRLATCHIVIMSGGAQPALPADATFVAKPLDVADIVRAWA